MSSRVVIVDTFAGDMGLEERALAQVQASVAMLSHCADEQEMMSQLVDADALIVDLGTVTRAMLDVARRCKVVVELGVGVDNIDVGTATEKGIYVANVPDYCVEEVADHTVAMALALVRNLVILDRRVRQGNWSAQNLGPVYRISRQTYGLLGLGRIAKCVARKTRALGFDVIAADPFAHPDDAASSGVKLVSLDSLMEESDVLSLHVPLNSETYHLFDTRAFRRMRQNAYLVNVSRGGIVETDGLVAALRAGTIAGAGLDVFEDEPLNPSHPLCQFDNVILSPHMAYYSESSKTELRERAVREVVRVLSGLEPSSCVNCEGVNKVRNRSLRSEDERDSDEIRRI